MRSRLGILGTLVTIVLALAAQGCASDDSGSPDHDICAPPEQQREIETPAATDVQFLIDRCRVDATNCYDLCAEVLEGDPEESVDSCNVTFEGDLVKVRGRVVDYTACDG